MTSAASLPGPDGVLAALTIPVLRDLRLELLRDCPLRCAHCSAFAAPRHPLRLPLKRALELVDEFADMGGQRLTLTGGEPLEYPGLEEVLRRCRARGVGTRLFSSGVVRGHIEPCLVAADLSKLAPLLDGIAFSLYSLDEARHDAVTHIPGSLKLTLAAVERAGALGVRTELHFVPTRLNRHELPDVVRFASASGVTRVGVLRFVPHGRGEAGADRLGLNREEYASLRRTLLDLRAAHPNVELHPGSAHAFLGLEGSSPCTAALDQLVVAADGRVSPCSGFGDFRVAGGTDGILEAPLREVWERSSFLEEVRRAHARAPGCTGCLAQKAIASGRIDPSDADPLEGADGRAAGWSP